MPILSAMSRLPDAYRNMTSFLPAPVGSRYDLPPLFRSSIMDLVRPPATTPASVSSKQRVAQTALVARQSVEQRDVAIVAARDEGASLREIARSADLSHSAVALILRRYGKC